MVALEKGSSPPISPAAPCSPPDASREPDAARILLASNSLTIEPFALAMRRGDSDFRIAVDRALSHIYRSGEIAHDLQQGVRRQGRPTPVAAGRST